MGQRTIYVREEHEPLWDRAKALAGDDSLSNLIAEGLEYVIARRERAMQLVTLKVKTYAPTGEPIEEHNVRFAGAHRGGSSVASTLEAGPSDFPSYEIYQTVRGRWIVHDTRSQRLWQLASLEDLVDNLHKFQHMDIDLLRSIAEHLNPNRIEDLE